MNKVYKRINWENSPSTASPINETNLNKMDDALDKVDTRVVEIYNQKDAMASATTAANKAADSANTAATKANIAAANANEAAQAVLDEKYILTATTEMVRSGTARPTAKGNALLEKLTGSSWQRKLMGKNKFDIETMLTSNATRASEYFVTNTDIQSICNIPVTAGEKYTITAYIKTPVPNESYPERLRLSVQDGKNVGYTTSNKSIAFAGSLNTEWQLTVLRFTAVSDWISISSLGLIRNDMQIELGSVSTEYEPYCGGIPSPNPEFPQAIRSTGDMGWFDGEWMSGYLDTGIFISGGGGVTSTNHIPCKEGDGIKIDYKVGNIPIKTSGSSMSLSFFKEDGSYLTTLWNMSDMTSIEKTVPSGATSFKFDVRHDLPITLSQVGHVCVTINGKYAAIVDEVGKNQLDCNNFKEISNNGIIFTQQYNSDGKLEYINVNGKATGEAHIAIKGSASSLIKNECRSSVILSGCPSGGSPSSYRLRAYAYVDGVYKSSLTLIDSGSGDTKDWSTVNGYYVVITIASGVTMNNAKFYPMIRKCDSNGNPIGDDAYVPHQSHRTYIPLDEPLRGIGDVKDELVPVDGVYKVLRRIGEVIFNGTEEWEESSFAPSSNSAHFTMFKLTDMKSNGALMTSHFSGEQVDNGSDIGGNINFYPLKSYGISGVDAWKTWLSENNVITQYELATPYYEDLDQTPFYNLQSFGEVTHVSIAGLHEELQPTFTMRFPRHEDGALVTTSYCNGKKNEIRMDELTAAMLALSQS